VIAALEAGIDVAESEGVSRVSLSEAKGKGLVEEVDLSQSYLDQVSRLLDISKLKQSGFKVLVDAMFGAGAGYLPHILAGGTTTVIEINGERNPAFPGMHNPEPIAHNLSRLSQIVPEQNAHVGLAMDGDADRLGAVDEKGESVTSQQLFALLAYYMLEVRGERGMLVKSVTASNMIHRLGERYGVPVRETPVGFKYIAPLMDSENALIGGEESGGYAIRGHIPERDGVLSALLILDLMRETGKSPAQLIEHLYGLLGPHYYNRRDITFDSGRRSEIEDRLVQRGIASLAGIPVNDVDEIDGKRVHLDGDAWMAVRFSGTEPLLRIYAEAESPQVVEQILGATEEFLGLK
jgi:phosphomannomutase